jgi:proteasome accessory factor A
MLTRAPLELASEIDWVAKYRLMNGYIARDHLSWDAPTLAAIDLQYSDIRPEKGLALRLEHSGHLVRMTTDAEVSRAVHEPPTDTRAYFRGECIRRFPESVSAASWDSIVLDLPSRESLMRVPTIDPLRGTREHVGALLESSSDVDSLVKALEASA